MYKKSTLLICFILVVFVGLNNQYFSQSNSFSEKPNENLSKEFKKLNQYAEPIQEIHSVNVDRSVGFEISNTILNGSALTKTLNYSGDVIFTSDAVLYLNNLKNDLLKDFPIWKNRISIYVTRSTSFNAFATVNNNIYVNVVLLATIENEYQLCYILCHEIMHIVNDHIINQKLEESGLIKPKYDQYDIVDNLKSEITDKHSISRAHEYEADLDGLRLFLHNGLPSTEAKNALLLLKKNGAFINEVILTSDLLFINENLFNKIQTDNKSYLNYFKINSTEDSNVIDFSTHPSIEQRLKLLSDFLEKSSISENQKMVQRNSFNFDKIKNDAKSLIPQLYAIEGDFISLFLSSSHDLLNGNSSEKRIGDLCYALQGIFHQKYSDDFDLPSDSLRLFFINVLNDFDRIQLFKWTINVLDILKEKYPRSEKLIKYSDAITQNISLRITKEEKEFVKIKNINTELNNSYLSSLNNISFEIPSGGTTLTLKQQLKFNEYLGAKKIKSKVAVSNIYTISVRRGENLRPLHYMEKIDLQVNTAFQKLQNNYPDQLVSFMPNSVDYSSNEYVNYQLLNNWLVERFYFDSTNYISYFQDDIDSLKKGGVEYLMTGINLEVRAINGGLFYLSYFGTIPFPHLTPLSVLKVCLRKKRKFMFSVVFNLERGEIVFWDKRTFLEANSVAQWYQNYYNVLTKMRRK